MFRSKLIKTLPLSLKLFLSLYLFVAVLGSFIANEKPLICSHNSKISFPAFNNNLQHVDCNFQIKAIIPYSHYSIDQKNQSTSPFSSQNVECLYYRHWLGTDQLGRDVLAGLIRGARISFFVGTIALSVGLFLGLFFGFLSGVLGDQKFKMGSLQLISILLGLLFSIFYIIYGHPTYALAVIIIFAIMAFFLEKYNFGNRKINIPLDWIITRFIELFKVIPKLFLLLFLMTIFKRPSYLNIILVISLISWPGITRFIRAELLQIKTKDYYKAAEAIGMSPINIFVKHGIRNAIQPVLVALAFGFAVTILLEATLSFLGLGIPPEEVSWGSMLNEARNNFRLWWMAIFPGLAIFMCVLNLNRLGQILGKTDTPSL